MELKIYFDSKYIILTDRKSTNNSLPTIPCNNSLDVKKALLLLEDSNNSALCLSGESFEDLLTIVKNEFLYLEAAGGRVINEQYETLCMYRRGFWDLPKGKLDKGETPQDAAIREVIEETGIQTVTLGDYICSTWHTYEHPKGKGPVLKQTYWYKMTAQGNQKLVPEIGEGITEVTWFANSNLQKVIDNTFPSIIDVLQA